MKRRRFAIGLVLATLALAVHAQSASDSSGATMAPGDPAARQHRAPPPEALAACQGKVAGASCSFEGRRTQTVNGTCAAPHRGASTTDIGTGIGTGEAQLICRPERGSAGRSGAASPSN